MPWTDYLHHSLIYASPQILVHNICQMSGYLLAHFKTKKRHQHKSTEQAGTVVMLWTCFQELPDWIWVGNQLSWLTYFSGILSSIMQMLR